MSKMNDTFEVIGFRKVQYTKKSTGELVEGYEVFLSPTTPPEDLEGLYGEKVWLSARYACYDPTLGDVVRKSYNRYGSVDDLISLS